MAFSLGIPLRKFPEYHCHCKFRSNITDKRMKTATQKIGLSKCTKQGHRFTKWKKHKKYLLKKQCVVCKKIEYK